MVLLKLCFTAHLFSIQNGRQTKLMEKVYVLNKVRLELCFSIKPKISLTHLKYYTVCKKLPLPLVKYCTSCRDYL